MSKQQDPKGKKVSTGLGDGTSKVDAIVPAAESTSVEVQVSTIDSVVVESLCDHLSEGKSLRSFCEIEGNPSKTTVLRWLKDSHELRTQYAEARARGMDAMADELIEIADNSGLDVIGVNEKTGMPIVDGEAISRARLRFDARRWLMSKLAPKKYGDKLEVDANVNNTYTLKFK